MNKHRIHHIWLLKIKPELPLRGIRFESIEAIKEKSRKEMKSILAITYKKYMDDYIIRWHKCIASEEDYFEGDKIHVDD